MRWRQSKSPHFQEKERDRLVLSNAADRSGAKSNDAVKRRVSEIGARSQQKLCTT